MREGSCNGNNNNDGSSGSGSGGSSRGQEEDIGTKSSTQTVHAQQWKTNLDWKCNQRKRERKIPWGTRRKGVAFSSFSLLKFLIKSVFWQILNFKFIWYIFLPLLQLCCAKFNLSFLEKRKKFSAAVPYNKLTLETSNGDVDGGHRWGGQAPLPSPFRPSTFFFSLFWWRSSSKLEGTRIVCATSTTAAAAVASYVAFTKTKRLKFKIK